jgi:hypothetical protein
MLMRALRCARQERDVRARSIALAAFEAARRLGLRNRQRQERGRGKLG